MFHYYHQRRHQNILFVVGAAENDTERLAEPRYQLDRTFHHHWGLEPSLAKET